MLEFDHLTDDDVASLERVYPLDLPTAVGEEEALLVGFQEDLLELPLLEYLDVLVIYFSILKLVIIRHLLFLELSQLDSLLTTLRQLNWIALVHSSDLTLEEVRRGWDDFVDVDLR